MLPLYTTIFTRCTFRLVSRPKRERERDLSHAAFIRFPRLCPRGRVSPLSGYFGERRSPQPFRRFLCLIYTPGGYASRKVHVAVLVAILFRECALTHRLCLSLFFSFLFSLSLSLLGTTGSTLRRSLANTFRRVSQAVLATCCCHGLVHKHLFLIKFR